MSDYFVVECDNPACRCRFPAQAVNGGFGRCPLCRTALHAVAPVGKGDPSRRAEGRRNPVEISVALDSIRSTHNAGAMFRTADGAGVRHLYVCGITSTPDNPKISKTALGAEQAIPWSRHLNILDLAVELKADGKRLWALEYTGAAAPLFEVADHREGAPIVLIVGNEVAGVDPQVLDLCERAVYIPMAGQKRSLNVSIAFGVAVYYLCWM